MRVLAVGAHPDDIEILCAGTLLRYAQDGHDVSMAVATNGEQGHAIIEPPELAEIRKVEAQASADLCGAELFWLGFPDEFIYHDHDTRMRFIELMRQARPDVVITHNPQDYHMDHRIVSELVFVSSFLATVPHVITASPSTTVNPPLYYMDSLAGANFVPTEYVDISGVIDRKEAMLNCHQSQTKWLKDHDNIDVLEFMRSQNRFRGLSCSVPYAEGFARLDAWGRNPVTRVLP
ncbi:MAG: PIG-L family deacetylase [Armatimonadetes bacterium]|nr:PIG-L family deacetylase [Armatimonadota bacterium]